MIANLAMVAAGGAIGAVLRYLAVLGSIAAFGRGFPYGVMLVNIGGSLLMGIGAALLLGRVPHAERLPLFFLTGILGGFTTFSAYTLDGFRLLAEGRQLAAAFYLLGSPALALAAFVVGLVLARVLFG